MINGYKDIFSLDRKSELFPLHCHYLLLTHAHPRKNAYIDTRVATKNRIHRQSRCHALVPMFLYMRNECQPKYSHWECSIAFIDSFQQNKWVLMLIITATSETRYATYDANVCMLTNKGSFTIEYQPMQTCPLINCNHVYFLMKLNYQKKNIF